MIEAVKQASPAQESQEQEYCVPYHYISTMPENGFAQHLVDIWGINYISTIEFILKEIDELQPRSLIDIGCGDGRLTREIHDRFLQVKVVGADFSARAIALARAMNYDVGDLVFRQFDISTVQFEQQFDAAILMEVYEHIPVDETRAFLEGVRRSLRLGGTLLVTVPHSNKPLEYKHFQHFTIETLTRDLSEQFDVVKVVPFERMSILRGLINRALCNRYFVLNHRRMLSLLYSLHSRLLFSCDSEEHCQRIFVRAVAT